MIETSANSWIRLQARFISRYAPWILAAIFLITLALVPLASRLKLRANFLDLLPKSYPSVKALNELTSHVGGSSFTIIVVESPDEKTATDVADRLTEKAKSFKQVDYVDNRTSLPAFKNRKLLFLTLESVKDLKKKIEDVMGHYRRKANPFFVDLLEEKAPTINVGSLKLEHKVYQLGGFSVKEKDSFMRVVLIKPKHPVSNFTASKALFAETEQAFTEIKKDFSKPVTMGITGPYKTRYDEFQTIQRDISWTSIVTTVLLTLLIFGVFRNIRSLVYYYLPLTIGLIWMCAFTTVSIGYLNIVTAFLLSILMGMGSDYAFHLMVSLEEDYKATGDLALTIEQTYEETWRGLLSSYATTVFPFYAMTISNFEGFRHFGIIAGTGITLCFIVVFYMVPSLFVVVESRVPLKRSSPDPIKLHKPFFMKIVLIAGILFSLFSLTQLPKMSFDYNFLNLQAKRENAIELAERIGKHFGVHLNPLAFITPNRERADQIARQINEHAANHSGTKIDFATSLTSHVPQDQEEKIKVLHEIQAVLETHRAVIQKLPDDTKQQIRELEEQLQATPLTMEDIPEGIKRQYEGEDQKISIVSVYPAVRLIDGSQAKLFVREARDLVLGKDAKIAGEPVIYADILHLFEKDTPLVLFISCGMVLVILFVQFRNIKHVFWVSLPVTFGVLWMLGLCGIFGVKFNYLNVLILSSVLGVGVDGGMYFFDQYRYKGSSHFLENMHKTSKGVIIASWANMAAFFSVACASHMGMASLGKIGLYGFLACLFASMYFIPAVVDFAERKYQHIFNK